jgi:hypothetical protein
VVTSVLQTTAGKMIFGRFIESPSGHSAATSSSPSNPAQPVPPPAAAVAQVPARRTT